MDSRSLDGNYRNMYTIFDALGIVRRNSSYECIEITNFLSGILMVIGSLAS